MMSNRKILLLAGLCLALAVLPGFAARNKQQEEDIRIREAREELKLSREILADVTNATERFVWQDRVKLAEKQLTNVVRMVQLEAQEKKVSAQRRTGVGYVLGAALRTIDTSTNEFLQVVREETREIQRLQAQRANLQQIKRPEEGASDDAELRRAEHGLRLRNLDASLLARTLKLNVAELQLRLARESMEIDGFRRTLDLNPRRTIRLIYQKKNDLLAAGKMREEYRILHDTLKTQRGETEAALTLAKQRFKHIDDEIEILQARYRVEKQTRAAAGEKYDEHDRLQRLQRMLNLARSEKVMLQERIRHFAAQCDALTESMDLAERGRVLRDAEFAFRGNDLGILKRRYFHRVLAPTVVILGIIVVYLLVSHYIFPFFFQKDGLFVARRLGNYLLLLVIFILLISLFLEDLKAIATIMTIVGAAVVIALQEVCLSFAGWFAIIGSRKIKVGDRVEIDGQRGDVIDIQMLRTTLLEVHNWLGIDEPTGRVIIIPNSFIFKRQVFNYAHVHPFIWGNVDITVTFESPARDAYDLFFKILEEETTEEFEAAHRGGRMMEKRYGLMHDIYKPRVHTEIADSGVHYTLFYVSHYRRFAACRDKLSARIVKEIAEHPTIEFAYPTERHIPTPPQPNSET